MIFAPTSQRALAPLLAALALVAAGCSRPFERPPVEKQRFALVPGRPDPVSGPRAGVLRVGLVRVSPSFQNRTLVLRTGEDTYVSDFYNEFTAPPGMLLRDQLVQWLADGSHFASVVRSTAAPIDWLLEVELEALYADLRVPAAPKAVIGVTLRLLHTRGATSSIVFQKDYDESEPAADGARPALVDAWNRALGRMLPEITADLDAAASKP